MDIAHLFQVVKEEELLPFKWVWSEFKVDYSEGAIESVA